MKFQEYKFIKDEGTLQQIVTEMKNYAALHVFDTEKAAKQALDSGEGEEYGPMVRIRGDHLKIAIPYTQFITLDGKTPLQLTLVEMHVDNKRVLQLSIVENKKQPLQAEQIAYIVDMFFSDGIVPPLELPDHVFIAMKVVGPIYSFEEIKDFDGSHSYYR